MIGLNLILHTVQQEKQRIENVQTLVARRRHIEAMVKSRQEEKVIADKVLEGAV